MNKNIKQQLLDVKQLSFILGISEFTVRKLAIARELPCTIVNKQPKFMLEELLAFFGRLERGGTC